MERKYLLTCDTIIFANEIVEQLDANNIANCVVDETKGPAFGYGPVPGISVYVEEKDYERAKKIVEPIVENRKRV